eukprot:5800121-Alexandrium_andersonii.AAC.1
MCIRDRTPKHTGTTSCVGAPGAWSQASTSGPDTDHRWPRTEVRWGPPDRGGPRRAIVALPGALRRWGTPPSSGPP